MKRAYTFSEANFTPLKKCSKCLALRNEGDFYFRDKSKGIRQGQCKDCYPQKYTSDKYLRTKSHKRQYTNRYYQENKDRLLEIGRDWREKNKERHDDLRKKWKENNKEKVNFHTAKRRAKILSRVVGPEEKIKEFYLKCPEGMEVDHILPINGKNVCGLHTLENLQYLSPLDNQRKSNSFDGTLDNLSWKRSK